MAQIKLVVDSNCNLPADLLTKLDPIVIPFNVLADGKEYKDGVNIVPADIYRICQRPGSELPKTSAVNINELSYAFKKALATYEGLVFITISSALSSTYQNAIEAINELQATDRIVAIDSKSLSCGIAILAERAASDIAKGLSLKQIKADLDDVAQRTMVEFVIDTLDNLYKGGRCSGLAFFFGKALHIHPIIGMDKSGRLLPVHKVRGKDIGNGVEQIIADFKADLDSDNIDFSLPVYCTDADATEWNERAQKMLRDLIGDKIPIRVSRASCVIAVHCGSGTFGIGWTKKAPHA